MHRQLHVPWRDVSARGATAESGVDCRVAYGPGVGLVVKQRSHHIADATAEMLQPIEV